MGSSPLNGSSRIMSLGSPISAVQSWTFCCMPFDSAWTCFIAHSASPTRVSSSIARSRACCRPMPLSSP